MKREREPSGGLMRVPADVPLLKQHLPAAGLKPGSSMSEWCILSCPVFHFPRSDKFGVARYLFQGRCRDVCPEGFFHSARKRCEPCPAYCLVCVAADRCLSCSPGHKLRDRRCSPLVCSTGERHDPPHGNSASWTWAGELTGGLFRLLKSSHTCGMS